MKKLFTLLLLTLLPLVASAYGEIEVDGIYYNFNNSGETKTAEVRANPNKYTGDITIPATVTYNEVAYSVTSIGYDAFNKCSDLSSVAIPNSVTSLGGNAFAFCNNLKSLIIPDNVVSIGSYAFRACSSLTSITIGSGVSSIDGNAFEGCDALVSVHISDLAAWCKVQFGYSFSKTTANPLAFAHHLFLNDQEIKDLVIPDGVIAISSCAFYGCSELTSVTIPSSLATIGNGAFDGCEALAAVHITEIGAWCNMSGDNLLFYAHHLFLNGEEIKDLVIPESVTSIRANAFANCTSITSVTIPKSVTNIGIGAFDGCEALTAVRISDMGAWCNISFEGKAHDGSNPLSFAHHLYLNGEEVRDLVIPSNVNAISDELFRDCSELTSVKIEEGATTIGASAFYGCNKVKTVEIPNSVSTIGNSAFRDCVGMTTVTLGDGVTNIGSNAFLSCTSLISLEIPNSVTSIGISAFESCTSLVSVSISEGIKVLARSIFKGCKTLNTIAIPEGVETVDYEAFRGCSSLKEVTLPNTVNNIGEYAFYQCEKLSSANIPEGVTAIGMFAYAGCSELASVSIPKSLTMVDHYAFANCRGLKKIVITDLEAWCKITFDEERLDFTNPLYYAHHLILNGEEIKDLVIPESIKLINSGSFYGCSGIVSVTFPQDLTMIKGKAFSGCSNLEHVIIPSKVEFVYQEAFGDCSKLGSIKCLAENPPYLYDNSFSNYEIPLFVPAGSIDNYASSNGWKKFSTILSLDAAKHTLTYKVDGEVYKTYELYEGETITPEPDPTKEGYDFSGWSTIPATMPAEDVTVTGSFTLLTNEDNIKITSAGQSTWCSKYDLDFTGIDGLKAYIASGYDRISGTIWLTRVYQVPANEGIFLMGNAGDYKVPHISTGTYYANLMVGTLQPITLKETDGEYTNYYLSNGDSGVGFYKVNGSVDLKANRAYLPLLKGTTQAGTRFIGLGFEDDGTTNLTPALSKGEGEGEWYTLQGQRVAKPGKGLYIHNGKKVVIK